MPNKESRLVYSTEVGRIKPPSQSKPTIITDGIIRISRETKGRKGKGVTLISGFDLEPSDIKALAKKLKKSVQLAEQSKMASSKFKAIIGIH